jgi:6-pyruvoyltetrahydropterin/6-carboxytetrahydropterin synthase
MPFRICKTLEIENGHMLSKHPDACRFPHGHSRKVEMILVADALDQNEMVCDFKILKEAMHDFLMSWDHAMAVNTKDPNFDGMRKIYGDRIIPFENQDPTTEVMAKAVYEKLKTSLKDYQKNPQARYPLSKGVKVASVKVWETSSSWAEYSEK